MGPTGVFSWLISIPYLFRQVLESLKNAVGTRVDGDRRAITPGDNAIFVDDEKRAFGSAIGIAIGAIELGDRPFRLEIGEQREMEMAVFGECFVAPGAIDGNAEKFGVEFLKFREDFIVESHLIAAYGAPVRGIEGEDDGASA